MRPAEQALARLAAADPAAGLRLGADDIERALTEILAAIASEDGRVEGAAVGPRAKRGGVRGVGRAPVRVLALALLAALGLAAVALAATGAFSAGKPVPHSDPHIGVAGHDLGTVVSSKLLPLSTPDPYGGPPWGMRVLYTSRGVGCLEVGRLVGKRLGVLGQEGAFANDGRFHELRPGRLSGGGSCRSLDGHGLLFDTAAQRSMPASGPPLLQSCLPTPGPGTSYGRLPVGGICPPGGMRQLYYGLLGPDARSIVYRVGKRSYRVPTAGAEGAYLIVLPASQAFLRHDPYGPGTVTSTLPWPWLTPIRSIAYSAGRTCDVAKLRPADIPELSPGVARARPARCPIPGYTPASTSSVTHRDVVAPLRLDVVAGERGHREIEVSFVARVGVSRASGAYQLAEDTSSPLAVFTATDRNVRPGERVAFRVQAIAPGTYSGTVTYTAQAPAPYPVYGYGKGAVVGRFRITLPPGTALACQPPPPAGRGSAPRSLEKATKPPLCVRAPRNISER